MEMQHYNHPTSRRRSHQRLVRHYSTGDENVQASNYHTATSSFDELHQETHENEPLLTISSPSDLLYHNSNHTPSISRSLGTQRNDNPTVLSSFPKLFSYGLCCCQCVRTQEVGVTEICGRFQDLRDPGLHCLYWPMETITARLSLRICQLDVIVETKTSDSVFVKVAASLFYRIDAAHSYDAFYRLADPRRQISSYVFDAVRSTIPKMTIDGLFESKDEIAHEINDKLERFMKEYGYLIENTIVTEIRPSDDSVISAMNDMNTSTRLKEATIHRAFANKIRIVKNAEGESEVSYLSGVGLSNERKAIAKGLKKDVLRCAGPTSTKGVILGKENLEEVMRPNDVMNLLVMNSYMDCMSQISATGSNGQRMILEHGPGTVQDLRGQVGRLQLSHSAK